MTSILGKIFGNGSNGAGRPTKTKGDGAYEEAMAASDDLLVQMRKTSKATDAARSVMADIWAQAYNIPFMATVYQAVQEAKSGPEQMNGTISRKRR